MIKELFGSEGCTAHHFSDYEPTNDTRIKERWFIWQDGDYKGWVCGRDEGHDDCYRVHAIVIQRREVQSCQHQGCVEKRGKWTDEKVIPFPKINEVGHSYETFKKIFSPDSK